MMVWLIISVLIRTVCMWLILAKGVQILMLSTESVEVDPQYSPTHFVVWLSTSGAVFYLLQWGIPSIL